MLQAANAVPVERLPQHNIDRIWAHERSTCCDTDCSALPYSLSTPLNLDILFYYMRCESFRVLWPCIVPYTLLLTHEQQPPTNNMSQSLPDRCAGRLMGRSPFNGVVQAS